MADAPPFQLADIRREWISGVTGESIYRRVRLRIAKIEAAGFAARERGVLIVERQPLRFAAAYLAATHLGVPVILGNPRWGDSEWAELKQQVNPAVIFGQAPFSTRKRSRFNQHPRPRTILIPTGGSTGGVKLAVHTWQTLASACASLSEFLGGKPINSACTLPLYHVSGLMQLMRSFLTGGEITFVSSDEMRSGRLPDLRDGRWCLSLVPTQLQRLIKYKKAVRVMRSAEVVFLGGAASGKKVLERARAQKLPIVQCYGMTETAAMVAVVDAAKIGSAAEMLPGVKIDIVDKRGRLCVAGKKGRIRIKTDSLFIGYHARPEPDLSRGLLTDDCGSLSARSLLTVYGRLDALINTGGEKVDPAEVEGVLMDSGLCEQVLVVGLPHREWGEQVVAFYIAAKVAATQSALVEFSKKQLVNFKIPKRCIEVDQLPVDDRGKTDRDLCKQLLRSET